MRKTSLMVAAAVTALTIGTGIAAAQSPTQPEQHGAAPKAGSAHPSGSMSPGAMKSGSMKSGETTGAGASTEKKNVDEFKAPTQKGAADEKHAPKQKGAQQELKQKGAQAEPKQKNAQENKAAPAKNRMGENNKRPSNERMGQSKKGPAETTGQAPSEHPGGMSKDNDQMKSGSGQMNRSGQSSMDNDRGQAGSRDSSTTNVNVNLSSEQRSRIKEVIVRDKSAPRVASVDFSLNVGTAVPRSVRLVRVPRRIVRIEPVWRGYEYFLVGNQIVIVNPRNLEIVAVIEA